MEKVSIKIDLSYNGFTIKEYLKACNIGRGRVESIRVNKSSFINGIYKDLETKLYADDILDICFDEEVNYKPLDKEISIVYEDDYILLVNKPSNMIIYPDNEDDNNTLANLVANYYIKNNIHRNVRYLHRIDKETTGIVIFAKDFLSEAILLKDIESHTLERNYLALIENTIKKTKGIINKPIAKDRHINSKMCVSSNGKEAITLYEVIKRFKDYSLVKFTLKTGRTHQIRVHASSLNCPLLGDVLYGGNMIYINRVALHSSSVRLTHPITKKEMDFTCPLPLDMKKLVG